MADPELDTVLAPDVVAAALDELPGWTFDGAALHATFRFADFPEAFGFMARIAPVAEKLNHHPDWTNVWNRVEVAVASHDAGGVTGRCLTLARAMSAAGAHALG